MKNVIKNVTPLVLLATAIIQWYGIGERTYHALRMWYKFRDYGGSETLMSYEMVAETYVLSAILILTALIIRKHIRKSSFLFYVNTIAVSMLVIGILCVTCLILSPIATLIKR